MSHDLTNGVPSGASPPRQDGLRIHLYLSAPTLKYVTEKSDTNKLNRNVF